jgi:acyl-CoA synthetase (AMP-forming)/AMP-acid ligase II
VRIVDPATGDEVPAGADGELLVRGASMYSGYVGSPPSPGWHRSGDIGRVDAEGYLYVTGRASSIVQIGANRVSTEEVAAAIRAHERIADTVVIALADPTWGDRLEAFVVREPGHDLTGTELLGWLRERLPAYKVPRAVHWLDTIPVDRSGKTSLRTLRELATARSQA